MVDINKTLDGTLDKAISASEKLKDIPKFMQSYMLAGDFSVGKKEKVNMTDTLPGWNKTQDYSARLAKLNKSQQEAVFKMTDFGDNTKIKEAIENHLQLAAAGKEVSGALVDAELKAHGFNDALREQILTETGLMDTEGNYLMVSAKVANANGEDIETVLAKRLAYKDCEIAVQGTELTEKKLARTILTTVFSQQAQTATTWVQKFALDALTITLSIAKQAAISFGIGLLTWAASKAVDYLKNLKTHSEALVAAMNDSHDAAQQATKDVEEIQSKIDELNKSLKDAGVDKIEDIVDPAERERLQAINDMLQAQLELKKQLEKDANDKANADTSAVVNDKTEKSIVKKKTVYLDVNGEPTDDSAKAVTTFDNIGEDITKTESLEEHTAALNELIDKRRELATAGKEDTQEYKDNEAAITSETEKVKTLSSTFTKMAALWKTTGSPLVHTRDRALALMHTVNLVVILISTALVVSPLVMRALAASMHLQKTVLVRSILTSKSMLPLLRMQITLCWQTSLMSSTRTFVKLARTTRRCATPWHSTPVLCLFRRPTPQTQLSSRMVSGISMLAAILVTQRRIVTPWVWTRTITRKLSLRLTITPMHRHAS